VTAIDTSGFSPAVIGFIEDNWGVARIGGGSFDQLAGLPSSVFDLPFPASPVPRL